MTRLHYATEITKKIFIGFGIGIASIIFLVLAARIVFSLKEHFFPTPSTPPTVSYGKLPSVPFPDSKESKTYKYVINTISGLLPTFSDRVNVYKIEQPQPSLLNFDTIQQIATNNDFGNSPTQLSDTLYSWQQTDGLQQKLLFDTITFNFSITTPKNYLEDQDVLDANHMLSQEDVIPFTTSFFQNFSSFPEDIDVSKTKITFYSIENGALVAPKRSSANQVIFVDFYQNDINTLPIVYPQFPTSLMHAVIASGQDGPEVKEASFVHKNVLTDSFATYPLKTVSQAYDELKQQKAYIANYDAMDTTINIRDVFLAYYIGENDQQFLYPVFVFKGDNNFYAFVSAITDVWLGN